MALLIVGAWFSQCSACGGNADVAEDRHLHGGPAKGRYSPNPGSTLNDSNGCGAVFNARVDEDGNPIAGGTR